MMQRLTSLAFDRPGPGSVRSGVAVCPGKAYALRICGVVSVTLASLLATTAGCSRVVWQPALQDPARVAQREGKLVLVYHWQALNEDCARMDRTVFRTREVCEQLKGIVPIRLDATLQRRQAEELGLSVVPAFVVISPTGEIVRYGHGPMDADRFIAFVVMARLSQ
ncbi:MAG: hypothetical protein GY842_03095 [bacterium]|nr:hypothetical protein [bacterium]